MKINAASLKDRETADKMIAEAGQLIAEAQKKEAEIIGIVERKINEA